VVQDCSKSIGLQFAPVQEKYKYFPGLKNLLGINIIFIKISYILDMNSLGFGLLFEFNGVI